jgi:hypothetical protein
MYVNTYLPGGRYLARSKDMANQYEFLRLTEDRKGKIREEGKWMKTSPPIARRQPSFTCRQPCESTINEDNINNESESQCPIPKWITMVIGSSGEMKFISVIDKHCLANPHI